MKFKNLTGSFKSFAIPLQDGSVRWVSASPNEVVDVPDNEAWRAVLKGLIKVEKEEKPKEPVKPVKKKIEDELVKIKGIGPKMAEEIAEEYDSVDEMLSDIKKKKFRVGGVDKIKLDLIAKYFK